MASDEPEGEDEDEGDRAAQDEFEAGSACAREARAAAGPAFDLLGGPPPSAFLRAGGHGIHLRDWTETLNFLDAHMRP